MEKLGYCTLLLLAAVPLAAGGRNSEQEQREEEEEGGTLLHGREGRSWSCCRRCAAALGLSHFLGISVLRW